MPSLVASHPVVAPLLNTRPQRAKLLDAMVRAVAEKGYDGRDRGRCGAAGSRLARDLLRAVRVQGGVPGRRLSGRDRGARGTRGRGGPGCRGLGGGAPARHPRLPAHARRGARVRAGVPARVACRREPSATPRCGGSRGATARASRRSGGPVPPEEALYVLAAGVHALACARVRERPRDDRSGRRAGGLRAAAGGERKEGSSGPDLQRRRSSRSATSCGPGLSANDAGEAPAGRGRAVRLAPRLPAPAGRPAAGRRCTGRASTAAAARR